MKFSAQELSRLPVLRDLAAEHRLLFAEVTIGKEALPGLQRTASAAPFTPEKFSPRQVLEFGREVSAAMEEQLRTDFHLAAMRTSLSHHESLLAVCSGDLKREVQQATNLLLKRVSESFYGEDIRTQRERIHAITGSLSEKSEALIELFVSFGAVLPKPALEGVA